MTGHDKFNSDELYLRKNNFCGFKYCPLCGAILNQQEIDNHRRLICTNENCDFIYYQNPIPAAGAIITKENKILLVKRAHPPRIGYWCVPAGFMEWDEHPSDTAVREVKEETGIDIKIKSLFQIYTGKDDPRSNSVLILYLADKIGGELCAADDALDVGYFDLGNLPGEIAFEAHIRAIEEFKKQLDS